MVTFPTTNLLGLNTITMNCKSNLAIGSTQAYMELKYTTCLIAPKINLFLSYFELDDKTFAKCFFFAIHASTYLLPELLEKMVIPRPGGTILPFPFPFLHRFFFCSVNFNFRFQNWIFSRQIELNFLYLYKKNKGWRFDFRGPKLFWQRGVDCIMLSPNADLIAVSFA